MAELKPCPFCGGKAKIAMTTDAGNYEVQCTKCPANVGRMWFWKKKEAIEAWNRRYEPQELEFDYGAED